MSIARLTELAEATDGEKALTTISAEHAHIHDGKMFHVSLASQTLAASGTLSFSFTLATGTEYHFRNAAAFSGAAARFEFLEAVTIATAGTLASVYNRNRASTATSAMTVRKHPASISGGRTLQQFFMGSGTGPLGIAGGGGRDAEWELDPTKSPYVIRLTNLDAGAEEASLELDWYEIS